MRFGDWMKNGRGGKDEHDLEYFEDTHGSSGLQYSKAPSQEKQQPPAPAPVTFPSLQAALSNMVFYVPKTAADVQTLIDFLKERQSAVVNLNDVEPVTAQRILDFMSGATYALNGMVQRVEGNIFVLLPEGVRITVPYESN